MAFIKSKKLYAILMGSEEGKDIVKDAPELSEEELQNRIDKFMGSSGSSSIKNTDSDDSESSSTDNKNEDSYNNGEDDLEEFKKGTPVTLHKGSPVEVKNARIVGLAEPITTPVGTSKRYTVEYDTPFGVKKGDYRIEDITADNNSNEKPTIKFEESNYKKPEVKDYSHIKNEKKKLDTIVGDVSHYTNDKSYDVLNFRETLEKNGFSVDYIENKSGTWQDHNGEKFKEYDIKLKSGTHIYFRLIADKDYDTKEVIAYTNGKGW